MLLQVSEWPSEILWSITMVQIYFFNKSDIPSTVLDSWRAKKNYGIRVASRMFRKFEI